MRGNTLVRVAVIGAAMCLAVPGQRSGETNPQWASNFSVEKRNLGTAGTNPWFVLEPGHRLTYEDGKDKMVTTVLPSTKWMDGAEVRVVEDREWKNGQLAEVTLDYYAIDRLTGDVYYFGEDVAVYEDGKVVMHEGSWQSGAKGAKFGLYLPAKPTAGQRFYQEQAPGVAMDRAEVLALNQTVTTPAGTFSDCVRIRETSAIEKGLVDEKVYARGVGLVKDGEFLLVKIDRAK